MWSHISTVHWSLLALRTHMNLPNCPINWPVPGCKQSRFGWKSTRQPLTESFYPCDPALEIEPVLRGSLRETCPSIQIIHCCCYEMQSDVQSSNILNLSDVNYWSLHLLSWWVNHCRVLGLQSNQSKSDNFRQNLWSFHMLSIQWYRPASWPFIATCYFQN